MGERFDFAERFIDTERDGVSFGRGRCARGGQLLAAQNGKLTSAAMMAVLRDHGVEGEAPGWTPAHTERRSICMHAAEGARRSQTTASWVSEWTSNSVVHWVTASAAPCLSIFKPVVLGAGMPETTYAPTDKFYRQTRWWKHELWHRGALCNFAEQLASIATERDALEAKFASDVGRAMGTPELNQVTTACWREADEAEARWLATVRHDGYAQCDEAYAASWAEHDRVGMVPPR